jgi:hypothetical protein
MTSLLLVYCLAFDLLTCSGKALVELFGNYHRLFWNCQTFAQILLRRVCTDPQAGFTFLSSSEATRMVCPAIVCSNSLQVLCCFVITAPFASSTATEEEQKCKEILRILEGQAPLDLPEILNISQTAIDYLFCQTLQEPSNRALLSPTVDNSTSLKYNVINQKIHFSNSG